MNSCENFNFKASLGRCDVLVQYCLGAFPLRGRNFRMPTFVALHPSLVKQRDFQRTGEYLHAWGGMSVQVRVALLACLRPETVTFLLNLLASMFRCNQSMLLYTVYVTIKLLPNACTYGYGTGIPDKWVWASDGFRNGLRLELVVMKAGAFLRMAPTCI